MYSIMFYNSYEIYTIKESDYARKMSHPRGFHRFYEAYVLDCIKVQFSITGEIENCTI